jgi:hypothetical protein
MIRHTMAAAHPHVAASSTPAPPPEPKADFADELRKLAAIRDDGLLTEYELHERRPKLLDS